MKRFFKQVAVVPGDDGRYRVTLDGRELRSPEKRALVLPTRALAEAVSAEWDSQAETIEVASMPLTSLVSTAVDRVGPLRDQIVREVVRYGETDLVCYRAEEPEALVRRQASLWQPLLDWAAVAHDATLQVHYGIVPLPQPAEALAALRLAVEALDDLMLAALSSATASTGSLIVALALVAGRVGPEEAAQASQLDELFQAEKWGDDPEAVRRRATSAADLRAADRLVRLLRG